MPNEQALQRPRNLDTTSTPTAGRPRSDAPTTAAPTASITPTPHWYDGPATAPDSGVLHTLRGIVGPLVDEIHGLGNAVGMTVNSMTEPVPHTEHVEQVSLEAHTFFSDLNSNTAYTQPETTTLIQVDVPLRRDDDEPIEEPVDDLDAHTEGVPIEDEVS